MALKTVTLVREDALGSDYAQTVSLRPNGRLFINGRGDLVCLPPGAFTQFELLPAASALATGDPHLIRIGTGTEVIARAAKGGVNLKSQSTTPADGDNVQLFPAATTTAMNALSQKAPRFQTQVAFNTITAVFASAGIDENAASNDVDPSGTAGDGAAFLFAPVGPGTGELTVDTAFTKTVISTITRDGNIATATCATAHGLAVGDRVPITGANQGNYTGQFKVLTVPSVTVFTFEVTGGLRVSETRIGVTHGNTSVTGLPTTAGLSVGDTVTGTDMATTYISVIVSATAITLAASVTSSTTGVVITFGNSATGSPVINWHQNWICHQEIAGADTFYKTNVPVVLSQDYDLVIEYDSLIVPRYYIDGVLVATGTAGTTAKSLGANIGLELTTTPAEQKDMDVRFVSVGQNFG